MANGARTTSHDVTIAGAGLVGQAMALALAGARGVDLRVRIVDASPTPRPPGDIRTYAIAASTVRMLEELGVWARLKDKAEACSAMRISDSKLAEVVRPVFLTIAGTSRAGEPFAHFVDGRDLQAAVSAACDEAGITVEHGAVVETVGADTYGIRIGGETVPSRLLIGADGARSAVRRRAGIKTVGWSYGQASIITIVGHDVAHDGAATQHFLPGGPFALLPLPGNRSGVVWTEPAARAERLVALPSKDFARELALRAGPEIGDITVLEAPRVYPLELALARTFVAPRIALVGDAAHRLHPLAGLGLNLGLRDAAALAQVVVDAARRGEDFGSLAVLERYQRWRRFDTVQVATATEAMNRLFSNDFGPLRAVRDIGLGLVDRIVPLKKLFVAEAAGDAGPAPRLLRGEPV
ncbi:FAD-dependent monooxygenase [Microbaculum marinum]|uniref:FAD-dependent monooxygenase n=2 Tax=Microbaculum marinum TaxID=1764581 RepID=A0AAW9RMU2_9HYPH